MATRVPIADPLDYRPMTVEEFQRMIAAGVFPADERIELIEAVLVAMVAINEPHAQAVDRSADAFLERLRRRYTVRIQGPIALPSSQVQPDLAVFPINPNRRTPPMADEVLLVVEIADTSLAYDHDTKRRLYAAAGIAEYWLVDLVRSVIEVYRDPVDGDDGQPVSYRLGETIVAGSVPNFVVSASDLISTVGR